MNTTLPLTALCGVAGTLLATASLPAQTAVETAPFEARSLTYSGGAYNDETFRYLLMPPEVVEEGTRYPLVLFLHGAGERGDDNSLQLAHFPVLFRDESFRRRFPCFVLAPQCRADQRWTLTSWEDTTEPSSRNATTEQMDVAVQALLETLDAHPVDRSRIYLTGLSMGGYGSWDLATRMPDWFAAVAPICGGGDRQLAHRLAALPVWAYHGDADLSVPVKRSRDMIAAIRHCGGLPRYTEIAGRGHDSWVPAYRENDLLPWMFRQQQAPLGKRTLAGVVALTSPGTPLQRGERIVFLGDSLTAAGAGPEGYITLLREAVTAQRPDLGIQWIGAGIGGHKVPDIQARLTRDVLSLGPSVVCIVIGVNDVWHVEMGSGTPADAYEGGLRDVIARCQKAGAEVVLATPPLIGEKHRGQNKHDAQLDVFAGLSRKVAARMGVTVCDLRVAMTDYLRVFNPDNVEKGILTTDGVHFTKEGNRFVADQVAQALFLSLANRR